MNLKQRHEGSPFAHILGRAKSESPLYNGGIVLQQYEQG